MKTLLRTRRVHLLCVALALALACDDYSSTGPVAEPPELAFSQNVIDLGEDRTATVQLTNLGDRAVGPIYLEAGPVTNGSGSAVAEGQLEVAPALVPTLNPNASTAISLEVTLDGAASGDYTASLEAIVADEAVTQMAVAFSVANLPPPGEAVSLTITSGPTSPRRGDVERYVAVTLDEDGDTITDPTFAWSVVPGAAGLISSDGRFVGYLSGSARIVASTAGLADTVVIDVTPRGVGGGSFAVIGQGEVVERYTSDLWVHGDYAYTGSWSCRQACGNQLNVWNVDDPADPELVDSVKVDARVVNDVKIRADGQMGVITHEASADLLNGITLLDLSNPASPQVITRYTAGLEAGVHNVWIEGDYVYIVVDNVGNGLRILDIRDPNNPQMVASAYVGSSFLHDVYVRDGLAFLSQWNDGLVILDVGAGILGGSPTYPREISRVVTQGGQTHNAWYWPEAGYVFVGEEDFGSPGVMHVVDLSNVTRPEEVATYALSLETPHNFWLDEEREILYMAWYNNGVRAIDVSGELMGQLERQGREIASIEYGSGSGCPGGVTATCTWAPQLHDGMIFASDLNTGLWVFQGDF